MSNLNLRRAVAALFSLTLAVARVTGQEKIIVLNEGTWQADNARVTYFENGRVVSNQWFRDVNGYKIGDTPNDIIQINDNLIAIAVNWSNIIQFITPEGKAVAATENVPNVRRLASDGRYVYVTSYAHECETVDGTMTFGKGYVAKIDISTFKVVAAVEVGYEPEGIALYGGRLFVANSGGYAFQEDHDYETTVSIIDPGTMTVEKNIDTGCMNLCGKMSQQGCYLLINSAGDFYDHPACSIVFDCRKALDGVQPCFTVLPFPATYSTTTTDGRFFAVGSSFSYLTGGYELSHHAITPGKVMATGGNEGIDGAFPGTVAKDIGNLNQPYGIYMNPYTGYIYATDAAEFASGGSLLQWDNNGTLLGKHKVYINPGHFLALPPDGKFTGIDGITAAGGDADGRYYDLQGVRVAKPRRGNIYIHNGKKEIFK